MNLFLSNKINAKNMAAIAVVESKAVKLGSKYKEKTVITGKSPVSKLFEIIISSPFLVSFKFIVQLYHKYILFESYDVLFLNYFLSEDNKKTPRSAGTFLLIKNYQAGLKFSQAYLSGSKPSPQVVSIKAAQTWYGSRFAAGRRSSK